MKPPIIIILSAAALFVLSCLFIPKAQRLQAQLIFLSIQFPIWLLGLTVVQCGWIAYPVHELSRANSTSFIFEYLILPIYCVHFSIRYPRRASLPIRLLYYGGASLLLTAVEVVAEKFTDIIEYTGWHWYMTFFSVLFILWLSRAFPCWFFKPYGEPDKENEKAR